MKNKFFIAMILIFFGLAGNAAAWQTELIAEGRLLSGITNVYSVFIGEESTADKLPAAPATPQYTTLLYIKSTPDNLYKDIRVSGTSPQIWTLFIDPHGNVGVPNTAFESTLIWDSSSFNTDGTYKLIAGEDGTGNVLIDDMRTTSSYTFSGAEDEGVFVSVVVESEPPPCHTEQTFDLKEGWNTIGSFLDPKNCEPDMLNLADPIKDDVLIKIVDNEGNSVVSFFGNWMNNIGDYKAGQGYRVKVNSGTPWTIAANAIQLPSSVTLTTGWNMIGYPVDTDQDAMFVLNPIIDTNNDGDNTNDNSCLEKVVDNEGNSIVKFFGSWMNNIGDFKEGQGYRVKMKCDDELMIDEPAKNNTRKRSKTRTITRTAASHFTKVWSGGAVNPMSIYVIGATIDDNPLSVGDEVAVFDNDKCVGVSVVESEVGPTSPLIVISSKDDGTGNGYTPGNPITIKIWDGQTEYTDDSVEYYSMSNSPISPPLFTADGDFAARLSVEGSSVGYCDKVWDGGASNPMSFYIIGAPDSIAAGDEIVILDGDKHVGCMEVTGNIAPTSPLIVITSKDDGSGNGFTPGNSVTFHIWDSSEQTVLDNFELSFYDLSQNPVSQPVFTPDSDYAVTIEFTELSGYCNKVWGGGAVNPMSLYIIEVPDYVEEGDEIIVKDGDKHVGCKVVTGEISPASPLIVILSKDDGSGNGYIPGHTIEICIWDVSEQQLKCPGVIIYLDLSGNPIIPPPSFTPDADYAVQIEENVKPVIILIPDNPYEVEKCTVFTDPGATASDPNDGDISGDIVVQGTVDTSKVGEYTLTYTVINTSGVAADPKTRVVNVIDTTDPVITISGANPMIIAYCATFNDPGATANDPNCNTDLTDQIIIEGSVDSCTPGTYEITYTVSDDAGNTVSITRTVTVLEAPQCDISVSPTTHNYGSTLSQINQEFTVSNVGDGNCNITDIILTGQQSESYAINIDNCSDQSISGGNNCKFSVSFPSGSAATGDHFASVDISSNDPDTPILSVSLQGMKPENVYYPFSQPKITPTHMNMYGVIYDSFDTVIDDNDVIGAFVDDGNGGQLIVGCGFYAEDNPGTYGLHIQGDDDTTQEKDGMAVNDTLILKIYDASEAMIYTASVIEGNTSWSSQANKEVDWKIRIKQSIPLSAGWNLISFSVNNCYYVGNQPTVPMIEGIEYIPVNSIGEILASLNDQYLFVRGFDDEGAKNYTKSPLSNLKYMAAGYGYWIKIDENADFDENGFIYLELEGVNVSANKPISLRQGWNLVGYIGNQVKFYDKIQKDYEQTVPFTAVIQNDSRVQFVDYSSDITVPGIFNSIEGKYDAITSSDLNGAKSYYPQIPQISDLKYVGPGHAYWIFMTEESSSGLIW